MSMEQLNSLAEQLRKEILTAVSTNGGHLSSNLGAVELSIALHYVFDTPKDKLIFDVGHQAYAHKLLTGRADVFSTLRLHNGLSGFPKADESTYDCFTSGHASTAISAALGMARARDLQGERYHVVAVVGDGALSGGMCYEALNDAGQSNTRLIVILNDNKMSISQNVGALSKYLTHLRQSRAYSAMKRGVRRGLEKIPVIGHPIFRFIETIKNGIKAMLFDGEFFNALGFEYIGPVDGHDLDHLIKTLKRVKETSEPVLIHVVTTKGKGYRPAEENPDIFHGIEPFDIETGKPKISSNNLMMNCSAFVGSWLSEHADNDQRVCAVTAAMEAGTGLEVFHQKHPERFFDVGIAEEHAVEMAAGMASEGMRPYVAVYSTFMQRAFDQILIDVCRNELPVVFLIDRAGLVGADGETHQGVFDLSYFRLMPNMMIASPRDIPELEGLLELSISCGRPMVIRYPKALPKKLDSEEKAKTDRPRICPGTWETMCTGDDVTVFAVGRSVLTAMEVRKKLREESVSCGVIDARFVKPIDCELLLSVAARSNLVVTIEENTLIGGLGEAITSVLHGSEASPPVICYGIPDRFVSHGSVEEQARDCGLAPEQLTKSILSYLKDADRYEKSACR